MNIHVYKTTQEMGEEAAKPHRLHRKLTRD